MKNFLKKLFGRSLTVNVHINTLVKDVHILDPQTDRATEALKEKISQKLQEVVKNVQLND